MNIRITLVFSLLCALAASGTAQTTHMVPQNYPSIQAGIIAAVNGDTVLVAPGVYSESINFLGKDLKVMSSAGAATTTIQGNSGGRVVTLGSTTPATAVLDGFTIKNGAGGVLLDSNSATIQNCIFTGNVTSGNWGGAGILIICQANAVISPVVQDCEFVNNYSKQSGGGIFVDLYEFGATTGTCLPTIQRCRFANNYAAGALNNSGSTNPVGHGGGGGLSLRRMSNNGTLSATITDCSFEYNAVSNWGGAAHFDEATNVTLRGCRFIANACAYHGGGAIIASGCTLDVMSCLFAGNASPLDGGAIYARGVSAGAPMTLNVTNSTITDNYAVQGGGIATTGSASLVSCTLSGTIVWGNSSTDFYVGSPVTATYCCLAPGPVIGSPTNVNVDPLFVNRAGGDYHLSRFSPLVDAGDPFASTVGMNDIDATSRLSGARIDIGADEVPAAALDGSGEDLELHTRKLTGGDPNSTTLALSPGDVLVLRLVSAGGSFIGANPLIVGQPYTTGFPPISPVGIPGVHLDGFMLQIVYGTTANGFLSGVTLPMEGIPLYYSVPSGLSGFSFRLQGFVISPFAANGAYAVTEAHDLNF